MWVAMAVAILPLPNSVDLPEYPKDGKIGGVQVELRPTQFKTTKLAKAKMLG